MIDSIFIAMTGLRGFERGLRVISNDTANLNTPGFKGATLQFGDLCYGNGDLGSGSRQIVAQPGYGVTALGTVTNFKQGQLQASANALDTAIDGLGFFVLRDGTGQVRYTRDGEFKLDAGGVLIASSTGEQVMGFDANHQLAPISIGNLKTVAASPTTKIVFAGNLSSTASTDTVSNVTVIDAGGASHTLSIRFDRTTVGGWNVTILDGATTVGTGAIAFVNGQPDPAHDQVSVTYTPSGQSAMPLTLDFSTNVTSYDTGKLSTLGVSSQDGRAAGNLISTTFDASGTLVLGYSNGQTVNGPRLALARFSSPDAVTAVGDNEFQATDAAAWLTGVAGEQGFGAVKSGTVEVSNVDLSQEFSDLVVMQRGYQAASQVVSTANDMLGELFTMRSK